MIRHRASFFSVVVVLDFYLFKLNIMTFNYILAFFFIIIGKITIVLIMVYLIRSSSFDDDDERDSSD